ncbi:MAG: hypothetical protein FJ104_09140, partial [Deltaproteobacteria bacterium]|nr:hypothetical protein [Deltaproteobacteria bacterium]
MRTRSAVTCAVALSLLGAGAAQGAEPSPSREVVFVEPAGGSVDPELRAALEAQLATSAVPLSFVRFAAPLPTLREQVAAARALAAGREVAGIFWLDDRAGDDWMLYLAEPDGDRVLVRRIEVDRGNLGAASEGSAVILRDSATALLAGSTLGMQPLALEPAPAPRAPDRVAPPPDRGPPP